MLPFPDFVGDCHNARGAITTRAGLVFTEVSSRKSPSLLKHTALLSGIVTVAIVLVAGAILAYSFGTRGTETAAAHGTPDGNLRDIASHAGFPVLVPAWLPQGVTLTSALGGSAGHSYDITLQYGPHPPIATLPLTYDVMETSNPSLQFGYQFVDSSGVTHPVQTTDRSVMIGGVPGTLWEYTCVWQGKVVLHALTVS